MTNDDKNRQFLLYTAPDGAVRVEVVYQDETVWLTQKSLAELFGVKIPAVNKHLSNIYGDGELQREGTISILEIVQNEGDVSVPSVTKLPPAEASGLQSGL